MSYEEDLRLLQAEAGRFLDEQYPLLPTDVRASMAKVLPRYAGHAEAPFLIGGSFPPMETRIWLWRQAARNLAEEVMKDQASRN